MQLIKLFPTTLSLVDASSVLEAAENFFNNSELKVNETNLETSLVMWKARGVAKTGCVEDENSKILKDFIIKHVEEYLDHAGYDRSKVGLEVVSIWSNKMVSGASQNEHNHVGCIMSGCLYLEFPENAAEIKFYNPTLRFDRSVLPINKFTELNSDIWSLAPKRGDMLIWASHIKHGVPAATFEGVRKTIAFDVVVTQLKID
jgi:uncharacterized protein (TIGR02466 family)